MKFSLFILGLLVSAPLLAQKNTSELPYEEIPDYPADYGSGNVIARMIDGLGYRYYWATEGLTENDLNYQPSDDARTTLSTLEHIYGLTVTLYTTAQNKPNLRPVDWSGLSFDDFRRGTLDNLKRSSDLFLGMSEEELAALEIVFQKGEDKTTLPFWHMINGPIADAIYHTGQIVTLRRASGNPINPKVNVFMGRNNP